MGKSPSPAAEPYHIIRHQRRRVGRGHDVRAEVDVLGPAAERRQERPGAQVRAGQRQDLHAVCPPP